ncbi:unnamed protein product [Sphagnum compactum]
MSKQSIMLAHWIADKEALMFALVSKQGTGSIFRIGGSLPSGLADPEQVVPKAWEDDSISRRAAGDEALKAVLIRVSLNLPYGHSIHVQNFIVQPGSFDLVASVVYELGNLIHTEDRKKHFTADQIKKEKVESPVLMRLCQVQHTFAGTGVAIGIMIWNFEKFATIIAGSRKWLRVLGGIVDELFHQYVEAFQGSFCHVLFNLGGKDCA